MCISRAASERVYDEIRNPRTEGRRKAEIRRPKQLRVHHMTGTIPLQDIKGEPLTGAQRDYLEGFFAGLAARGLKFSDVEPKPQPEKPVPAEDLIFEERVKRELHPLDAYPLLLETRRRTRRRTRRTSFASSGRDCSISLRTRKPSCAASAFRAAS